MLNARPIETLLPLLNKVSGIEAGKRGTAVFEAIGRPA